LTHPCYIPCLVKLPVCRDCCVTSTTLLWAFGVGPIFRCITSFTVLGTVGVDSICSWFCIYMMKI
jgi:hypothetical protein